MAKRKQFDCSGCTFSLLNTLHDAAAANFKAAWKGRLELAAQRYLGETYAYGNAMELAAVTPEQKKIIKEMRGTD